MKERGWSSCGGGCGGGDEEELMEVRVLALGEVKKRKRSEVEKERYL